MKADFYSSDHFVAFFLTVFILVALIGKNY